MDRTYNWQDVVNFLLGLALFVSPFVLGYQGDRPAAMNAYIVGAIVAILALASIFAFQSWEEWLSALLGAWLIISPWALGFSSDSTAVGTHVVLGIAIIVLSLWSERAHGPGQVTLR